MSRACGKSSFGAHKGGVKSFLLREGFPKVKDVLTLGNNKQARFTETVLERAGKENATEKKFLGKPGRKF